MSSNIVLQSLVPLMTTNSSSGMSGSMVFDIRLTKARFLRERTAPSVHISFNDDYYWRECQHKNFEAQQIASSLELQTSVSGRRCKRENSTEGITLK